MEIGIISLFPEMFECLSVGIPGRAQEKGLLTLHFWNPRDYATDNYGTVDDKPYGGGPGMVMMVEPLMAAITQAKQTLGDDTPVIYMSPQGKTYNHAASKEFAKQKKMILLAGRYEGVDERVIELAVDEEWSIGDYVLSGGELAICVIIDALIRHLPGALGGDNSAQQDSFVDGLLEYPQYTRPESIAGLTVPSVLTGGNHAKINRWRKQHALARTWQRRPDLWAQRELTDEEQALLAAFIKGDKND